MHTDTQNKDSTSAAPLGPARVSRVRRPEGGYRHAARSLLHPVEMALIPRLPLPDAIRQQPGPPAVVLCVTRRKHSDVVLALHRQAQDAGARCYFWALDEPIDGLADMTVGTGPGPRTELLNRLAAAATVNDDDYVVIADDDVEFAVGDLAGLLRICDLGQLVLAQPTHLKASVTAYPFNHGRTLAVARVAPIVESGPLVVVGPAFRDRVLPVPDGYGMGWGLGLLWSSKQLAGERFGIVDAVRVRHRGIIGADYTDMIATETKRLHGLLDERGLSSVRDLQRSLAVWRRWQPRPPWLTVGTE
jgi:hypothetical protein